MKYLPAFIRGVFQLFKSAAVRWQRDNAERQAAALAYHSVFSLTPLLMLGVAASTLVAGRRQTQTFMAEMTLSVFGERGAEALKPMLESAGQTGSGLAATAIGLLTMLMGASGVFVHLQDALNEIWEAPPHIRRQGVVWTFFKRRVFSAVLVLAVAGFLLMGPAVSALLAGFGRSQAGGLIVSLGIETLLFGVIFKVLPDVSVPWRHIWLGALLTAALFTLSQHLLGLYLERFGIRSLYGAAGSLVALLFWVYISAQILLFGAEFIEAFRTRARPRRG